MAMTALSCGSQPNWRSDSVSGMTVSPDGNLIAFIGRGRGGSDIYLLDIASSKVTQVTDSDECERNVRFSPSSRFLVYTAGGNMADSSRSVCVKSLDGSIFRRVTRGDADRIDTCPTFSDDESKIAFMGSFAPRYNSGDLFVVDADGRNLRRLTHGRFNGYMRPRFYDDDKIILFETYKSQADPTQGTDPPMVISSLPASGGDWHETIHVGAQSFAPDTAPQSKTIVFCADYPKKFDHELMIQDGLESQPRSLDVGRLGSAPICPCYIPSQKCVYFMLNYLEIWRVGINGEKPVQIADSSLFDDPMHWKTK